MIVYKSKFFAKSEKYPDTDWLGNADWVLDDNDEKDEEIEAKIISLYPNFEFVFDGNGQPVDVTETEPEPKPPAPPTNAELAAAIAELAEVICGG